MEAGEERGEGAHVRGKVLVAAALVVVELAHVAELERVVSSSGSFGDALLHRLPPRRRMLLVSGVRKR